MTKKTKQTKNKNKIQKNQNKIQSLTRADYDNYSTVYRLFIMPMFIMPMFIMPTDRSLQRIVMLYLASEFSKYCCSIEIALHFYTKIDWGKPNISRQQRVVVIMAIVVVVAVAEYSTMSMAGHAVQW